ncbi:MAG: hypothetical protein NTAFB05_05290 [Nitrobacter sp.]|uniref:hypothetical protein n=1 Tax=Nitrobacter sp. TaxID=29420 RepID=UPI00387DE6B8
MTVRRGIIQQKPLKDRLVEFAANARKAADELPPGARREEALKRARQADTAAHIDAWVNSSGLQTPK